MTQKLLIYIDANISWRVSDLIREMGHEAVHVNSMGLLRYSDRALWDLAASKGAVVFTKDRDFLVFSQSSSDGKLLFYRGFNSKRVPLMAELSRVLPPALLRLKLGAKEVQIP